MLSIRGLLTECKQNLFTIFIDTYICTYTFPLSIFMLIDLRGRERGHRKKLTSYLEQNQQKQ